MLYLNKLEKLTEQLNPEFNLLFQKTLENQKNIGDLLIVYNNFSKSIILPKGYSPFVMGLNFEGFSERTHYDFINTYRKNNLIENESIDISKKQKELSIQIEMLIYLKIWECDSFIKKLYQITRLLNGEPYDWNFRITYDNHDSTATGTRQKILREKIRDKFKSHFPNLFMAFKKSYVTQIRNAVAHSQYYILDNVIGFNNYVENSKYSNLSRLTFKAWSEIFHTTLIIYNEYILFINKINKYYISESLKSNNDIPIKVKDNDSWKNYHLKYINKVKRWQWID